MHELAASVPLPKTSLQKPVQPLPCPPLAKATLLNATLPNVPATTPRSTLRLLTPDPSRASDRAASSSCCDPPMPFLRSISERGTPAPGT
jgi:hypothetical protein